MPEEVVTRSLQTLIKLECNVYFTEDPLAGLPEQLRIMRQSLNVLEDPVITIDLLLDNGEIPAANFEQWTRLDDALNDPRWFSL